MVPFADRVNRRSRRPLRQSPDRDDEGSTHIETFMGLTPSAQGHSRGETYQAARRPSNRIPRWPTRQRTPRTARCVRLAQPRIAAAQWARGRGADAAGQDDGAGVHHGAVVERDNARRVPVRGECRKSPHVHDCLRGVRVPDVNVSRITPANWAERLSC